MRLFTAIELPEEVRGHLGRVAEVCAQQVHGVRWTPAANLHLTLKFIGEVPDARVPELINALEAVVFQRPLELACERLVCFPPRGSARIVAAEVGGEVDPLRQTFERIEAALEGFCLKEPRRYTPHITLGRSKPGVGGRSRELMEQAAVGHWPGPPFEIDEFVLYQSDLSKAGPIYTVVARFG